MYIDPKIQKIPKTPLGLSGIVIAILKSLRDSRKETYPIEISHKVIHTDNNNYPVVYVQRDQTIPNPYGHTLDDDGSYLNSKYGTNHSIGIDSAYSIIIRGYERGVLETLANDIFMDLIVYRRPIERDTKITIFETLGLSSVRDIDKDKNIREIIISLKIHHRFSWELNTVKPLIKRANINDTN
jgi:hypothetical protein